MNRDDYLDRLHERARELAKNEGNIDLIIYATQEERDWYMLISDSSDDAMYALRRAFGPTIPDIYGEDGASFCAIYIKITTNPIELKKRWSRPKEN